MIAFWSVVPIAIKLKRQGTLHTEKRAQKREGCQALPKGDPDGDTLTNGGEPDA
ncbi:MAG: hypothetical protein O3C21_20075 [Verrucomicrobia bacterium]|nr:hypothetical protein [Verrucomicrobiota bacterium]